MIEDTMFDNDCYAVFMEEEHEKGEAMDDTISRQAAVDAVRHAWAKGLEPTQFLEELPPAQPEQDVLAWLLAYHTKSFELHGRYFPHEVISWLVNDFSKEFIAERREE